MMFDKGTSVRATGPTTQKIGDLSQFGSQFSVSETCQKSVTTNIVAHASPQ